MFESDAPEEAVSSPPELKVQDALEEGEDIVYDEVSTSQAYNFFSQFEEAGLEFKPPELAQK